MYIIVSTFIIILIGIIIALCQIAPRDWDQIVGDTFNINDLNLHEGPVSTEDCEKKDNCDKTDVCHKSVSSKESLEDLVVGNVGIKTIFIRQYDSYNNNGAKKYRDVYITNPNSLSLFSEKYGYNPELSSVFLVHGFLDRTNWHLFKNLASAFLHRGDVNVFSLDWGMLNIPPYFLAVQNLKLVAHAFAEFLNHAVKRDLIKTSDIHLIGHSLGAHLLGYVARNLDQRPPVVIGLDPAGPEFETNLTAIKLTHEDAECVHYIQTNRYVFGTWYDLGHATYKFNGRGILQPGCYIPSCSHLRAVEYFAEAVKNPGTFIAINCESYEHFMENRCTGRKSVIGFPPDLSAKGLHFITTNSKEPFGRGEDGAKPEDS